MANTNYEESLTINAKPSSASNLYGLDKETYRQIKQITHRQLVSEMRLDRLTHIDLTDSR